VSPVSRHIESSRRGGTIIGAGRPDSAFAGNQGPSQDITGSPGSADGAIAVAAIDPTPTFPGATLQFSPGVTLSVQNSNNAAFGDGTTWGVAVLRSTYPSGPVALGCAESGLRQLPGRAGQPRRSAATRRLAAFDAKADPLADPPLQQRRRQRQAGAERRRRGVTPGLRAARRWSPLPREAGGPHTDGPETSTTRGRR